MRRSGTEIFLLILKILISVVIVGFLAYVTTYLVQAYIDDMNKECPSGEICIESYGILFALFLYTGFFINGGASIVGLIGLIVSIAYKNSSRRKGNIIAFILLTIAPIAAEILLIYAGITIPGMLI